jgi:hypothetical protein
MARLPGSHLKMRVETGSGVAAWLRHIARQRHYIVAGRESGIMAQGKFDEAPVNAEPKKRDGRRFLSSGRLPLTLKERRKNLGLLLN